MVPIMQKLCAFIVVLAIAVSLTAGTGAWAMSGDMAGAVGIADVPSPTCDEGDCPDHSMPLQDCHAVCSGTLAVLSTGMGVHHWADRDFYPSPMAAQIGQSSSPDPSPPRFSVLS